MPDSQPISLQINGSVAIERQTQFVFSRKIRGRFLVIVESPVRELRLERGLY